MPRQAPPAGATERKLIAPTMTRAASITPSSFDESDNSIEIVWSTGAAGLRFDWYDGEYYIEELSMEPGSVRLDRLNSGAPLLDSHRDYNLGAVLGSVVPNTARVENGQGIARVRLATTPDVADTVTKIKDGHIRNVSVGYAVHEYMRTEKEGEKPHLLATDWEPMELSMVAVPFDAGAQVRARNAPQGGHPCIIRGVAADPQEPNMPEPTPAPAPSPAPTPTPTPEPTPTPTPEPTPTPTPEPTPTPTPELIDDTRTVTSQYIRQRAAGLPDPFVLDLVSRHADNPLTRGALDSALVEEFTRQRETPPIDSAITIGVDERDKYRNALRGALLVRITDSSAAPKDGGEVFGHMTVREIARDFLVRSGERGHAGMGPFDLVNTALGLKRHGAMTSSDFAVALQQAGNLAILESYEQAGDDNWRQFSRETSANDFRPMQLAGLTGTPEFLVVEENGEYTYASFQDIGDSFKLWTAGRIISLSRQLIINDQLGLFGDMAGQLGRGAALHEANAVWATLLGNPLLGDGVALFHATHGNLAALAAAPTVVSLGAARAAMRKQKDRDGVTPINVVPKFLIIGPDLETAVDQLLTVIQAAQVGNAVPAFIRTLTVIVDPRITDYSWYLLADPARVPVLQHAYLRGQRGIYTDTRVGFEVDGVEYKGRLDFSAKARGFQGAYKNAGAAPA